MNDCPATARREWRTRSLLAFGCCIALWAGGTARAAEISFTTDGKYQLINRLNGSERWMLARELATGRIVANVFDPTDPLDLFFFDCIETGSDGANYFFACMVSAGGAPWSDTGLENVLVARSFFGEGEPPPGPPTSCVFYTDACGSPPHSAQAQGGSLFVRENSGPWGEITNAATFVWYELDVADPLLSAGRFSVGLLGGTAFQRGEISLSPDGRIVMESQGAPGGGDVTICGGRRVIRTRIARLELCSVCGIDGPVTGTFHTEVTVSDGSLCSIDIEFRAFRTE